MKNIIALLLLFLFLFSANLMAGNSEYYIKFDFGNRSEVGKLTKVVSIDNIENNTIFAYANEKQLRNLEFLGYTYEVLDHPGTLIDPPMATDKVQITEWDSYPTYDAYVTMMYQFASDYPDLCEIINVGSTVEGRDILFARISDNLVLEEDEPEVMFTSSMHGDETTGYVLMLRLIDSILVTYGSDSLITRLVDSCEIWINPLANPDGTYASGNSSVYGATRTNANGVDINRNFPDPKGGPHPDGYSWQPETVAMMNLADDQSFVISANFHGGTEVVNYPWDTWSRLHVDDNWYVMISHIYADSAQHYSPSGYMDGYNDGITNGNDWYEIEGGRQDYMNYWHGCREVTVEISNTKLLSASQLPAHWVYNRVSFLDWLENGLYGIRGVVTDAVTGAPVFAKVEVIGHDTDQDSSRVFTDPDVGDYHRMIEAGIYDVRFSAPGYYSKTVKTVTVSDWQATRADVSLTPLPDEPDLAFVGHDAGTVDPGDNVSMHITLSNSGAGNATGVTSTLFSDDSYITVTQPNSTFPTISALGGSATSDNLYQFTASASCPLYHTAQFGLEVSADGGYWDTVYFEINIGQVIEDFESGDFSSMPWEMLGSQDWTVISSNPYEGTYCSKSGAIGNSQYTEMSLTLDVNAAADITFYYKVSSESGWDYLRFYIDGVKKDEWSGEVGWTQASYAVAAGNRTFSWEYYKDGSWSSGDDCAWIDKIVFPPVTLPAPEIITQSLPDWTEGMAYSHQMEANGGTGTLTWNDMNDDLSGTGLSLTLGGLLSGTPNAAQTISFTAEVTDEGGGSDQQPYSFAVNPMPAINTETLPSGNIDEPYSQQLDASGGTGAITWSDKNDDLAGTGLTLSSSGLLSGTVSDPDTTQFTALIHDNVGAEAEKALSVEFIRPYVCGDANGDSLVNVGDAVFVINFVFKDGPWPDPTESGYANGDEDLNVGDAVYLINYVFKSGDSPICP